MNSNKYEIYKVKDKADSYYTHKDLIFDIPYRLLLIGKSQFSGKSSLILNILLRPEFYLDDFKGDNIFLFSASKDIDEKLLKLIQIKNIPQDNIVDFIDEDYIEELYNMIEENYKNAVDNKEKPQNTLFIFDDIAFNNKFNKQRSILSKLFTKIGRAHV